MGNGWMDRGFASYPGVINFPATTSNFLTSRIEQCSHEENFQWMNRKDDGTQVVKLANPKSLEYQVIRTSLLPGLLKTIRENRAHNLPLKIFETADIVVKDKSIERQARNIRKAAAVWCNKTAGFEVVHGLLDRLMATLEVPRISSTDKTAEHGYYLKEVEGMASLTPLLRELR
jgi:phenylalanyl-tRNA synthetase beta chain